MTALVAAVVDDGVLVRRTDDGPALPEALEAEGGTGPAELAAAWGLTDVRVLVPALRPAGAHGLTLHVVTLSTVPPDAVHLPADALDQLRAPPGIALALAEELAVLAGRAPWPERRPDWYRPGWVEAVDAWVDDALAAQGRRRTAPSQPVRIWSLSAVLRVPTTGGDVVVKAVGDHFLAEPKVTAWLHGLAPGRVPTVLAIDPSRGWTLMEAFPGEPSDPPPSTAPAAARVLAALQVVAAGRTQDLLATGVPDRTPRQTLTAFAAVTREGLGLEPLDTGERAAVATLPEWLGAQADALEATGLPPTLVHGDLHTGNYVIADDGPLLFDWTDAALGHPALDAFQLATSAGRVDPAAEQPTLAAWAEVWRAARPTADVEGALALAEPWFWAYQVVSYDGIVRAQEDRSRSDMGGITARALRRLLALSGRQPGAGWQRGHQ